MLLNCCIVGVNPPELAKLVKNAAEDNVRSVYICVVFLYPAFHSLITFVKLLLSCFPFIFVVYINSTCPSKGSCGGGSCSVGD
jgi:hypothetical protein